MIVSWTSNQSMKKLWFPVICFDGSDFWQNLRWGLPDINIMNASVTRICWHGLLWIVMNDRDWTERKRSKNTLRVTDYWLQAGISFWQKKHSQYCAWGRQGSSSTDIHEQKKTELSQKVIPKTGHFWTCGVIKFLHCFCTFFAFFSPNVFPVILGGHTDLNKASLACLRMSFLGDTILRRAKQRFLHCHCHGHWRWDTTCRNWALKKWHSQWVAGGFVTNNFD